MTVVPGDFERKLGIGIQTGHVIDALRRGAEIFEPHGLVMVLEALSDTPDLFLRHPDQTYMICEAVNNHPTASRITMATWTPGEVERSAIACTGSPIAWVSSVLPTGGAANWNVDRWNLGVNALLNRPAFVEEAHSVGQFIYAWTVNDPATMLEAAAVGIDSIITDYPARCVETLGLARK